MLIFQLTQKKVAHTPTGPIQPTVLAQLARPPTFQPDSLAKLAVDCVKKHKVFKFTITYNNKML